MQTLEQLQLAEIAELVGPGGDDTPFGRVESMLSALTTERDELRACLSILLYWHDHDHGDIDKSWWEDARDVLNRTGT